MPISRAEYSGRNDRLRQKMQEEGLDALIVFSDEYRSGHGTYLTGYKPINVIEESPQVVIYVGDEAPVVLLGRLNLFAAKDVIWTKDVRPYHLARRDHPRDLSSAEGSSGADRIDRRQSPSDESICPVPGALPNSTFTLSTAC